MVYRCEPRGWDDGMPGREEDGGMWYVREGEDGGCGMVMVMVTGTGE